jgi:hypothetical protein
MPPVSKSLTTDREEDRELLNQGPDRLAMSVSMLERRTTALLALLLFGTASQAQPNKEQYELQERCGKRAAEFFAKAWASEVSNTASGQTRANYENHYNSRLNKCIYLEISNSFQRGEPPFRLMRLFDLNENREIATYMKSEGDAFGFLCSV